MMMSKAECKEKFFDKSVKLSDLYSFQAVTPQKNTIEGYICNTRNHFLGSMVILKVNDQIVSQYVQSMPKISYYNYDKITLFEGVYHHAYEKLDGTCLILYPLFDENNEIIEIIPKTRGTPVADDWILEMYKYIDDLSIKHMLNTHPNMILLFELYGVLNQHEIFYSDCYIDLVCIGMVQDNTLLDGWLVDNLAQRYHLKRPRVLYTLMYQDNHWRIHNRDKGPLSCYDDADYSQLFDNQQDMFEALKHHVTQLNDNYRHRYNRSIIEGVVLNGLDVEGQQIYIKCKPKDIEELHRAENGIKSIIIRKEVYKYFDEYGVKAQEIYQKDPTHYVKYIVDGLSEEFSDAAINNPKTKQRMESAFLTLLESRTPSKGLQQICSQLIDENQDKNLPELMKIFGEQYPEKKNKSRMVFSLLKSMKGD